LVVSVSLSRPSFLAFVENKRRENKRRGGHCSPVRWCDSAFCCETTVCVSGSPDGYVTTKERRLSDKVNNNVSLSVEF
jgi:hypothetical protein